MEIPCQLRFRYRIVAYHSSEKEALDDVDTALADLHVETSHISGGARRRSTSVRSPVILYL